MMVDTKIVSLAGKTEQSRGLAAGNIARYETGLEILPDRAQWVSGASTRE